MGRQAGRQRVTGGFRSLTSHPMRHQEQCSIPLQDCLVSSLPACPGLCWAVVYCSSSLAMFDQFVLSSANNNSESVRSSHKPHRPLLSLVAVVGGQAGVQNEKAFVERGWGDDWTQRCGSGLVLWGGWLAPCWAAISDFILNGSVVLDVFTLLSIFSTSAER